MTTEQKTIPKGWQVKTIDDVSLVFKGKGLSKDKIGSSGKNKCILYGQLFTTYNEIIREVKSKTDFDEGVRSQNGDVLMPGSTTTKAEDLAIASAILEDNVLLGGDINILRKKDDAYDPIFLAYYLTHYKRQEVGNFGQGITIIHLYGRDIRKIQLALPPLFEQKRIVEILSTVDDEIQKTNKVISQTEKLKKGLIQDLFTKNNKIKKLKIKDVSEVTSSKRVMVSDYVDEGIPFYRSTEIIKKSKNIPLTDLLYISAEKFNFFKNRFGAPEKGDILITAVGTIGDVYMVQNEVFYFKDGNTIWVRKIKDSVLPEYLRMILGSNFYREKLNNIAGGSSQKALTIQKLENVEVPVPSISEQKKLIEVISSVENKTKVYIQTKNNLDQLKKGLAQDLLSGKVRTK
jgi:type I restriction enzyme S subunit